MNSPVKNPSLTIRQQLLQLSPRLRWTIWFIAALPWLLSFSVNWWLLAEVKFDTDAFLQVLITALENNVSTETVFMLIEQSHWFYRIPWWTIHGCAVMVALISVAALAFMLPWSKRRN